ncbi:MAG: hypothetical protein F4Y44_07640 [Chloroflexi bacterium]|nr:hypothetical protein [Chloroflexota bacterium]
MASDRLVNGRYEPIVIEEIERETLRGYRHALGRYACWEYAQPRFFDAESTNYLSTHEEDRLGRENEEVARLAAELL